MNISKNRTILTALLGAHYASQVVNAHGYLKTPRSRNYYASINSKWWGGTFSDPAPENCPHCLNIGGTEARCGKVGDHNYDYPTSALGGVLAPTIQACYDKGSVIEVETILTAHHKGHFTFKACAISAGEVPTQECFNANPLAFVSDELYGANPDPLYPERAYIPRADYPGGLIEQAGGEDVFRHKFRLPQDLVGDLILIQWHYITANSCTDVGYDTYDWPEGFYPGNVPVCDVIPPDGRGVPEQFWNCAEVEISNNCGNGGSKPSTASPTAKPTKELTDAPTGSTPPTTSPTAHPTLNPTGAPIPDLATTTTTTTGTTSTINTGATVTTNTTTSSATTTTSATSISPSYPPGEQILNDTPRCGTTELDARENCKPTCQTDADCPQTNEFCWHTHANYCGSIPQRMYEDPVQSPVVTRCGVSEELARTFCGEPCSWQCSKPGESCIAVHSNYCDSPFTEVGVTSTTNAPPVVTTTPEATTTTTTSPESTTTTAGTTTSTNTGATVTTTTVTPPATTSTEAATTTTSTTNSSPTTLFPTSSPTTRAPTSSAAAAVEAVLEENKDAIDNSILLYQNPSMQWEPSSVYRYNDLLAALRVMYNDGVANKYFYMGDDSPNGHKYGLVNIAAFLAQSMKETIRYNACDENSWDMVGGKYPLSNACGQLGQSYQDYKCSADEAHMECPVKSDMTITATTNAKWYGAPAPMFCGPKKTYPFAGYWDHSMECNKPWANPPEYCDVYEGQKAGGFVNTSPVPSSSGRTDVEGCCFWGRGVIQTTGVCNFGKLNYFLGKRAADEGRDSRYPDIDFCEQPDAICASQEYKELKWIAGMFYWVESLQSYNVGGWDYVTELQKFVDNGMTGNSFIDSVSGIVNRGCHNPPCATGDVDGKADRSSNFFKVLTEFDLA